jgi:hypothetical protein
MIIARIVAALCLNRDHLPAHFSLWLGAAFSSISLIASFWIWHCSLEYSSDATRRVIRIRLPSSLALFPLKKKSSYDLLSSSRQTIGTIAFEQWMQSGVSSSHALSPLIGKSSCSTSSKYMRASGGWIIGSSSLVNVMSSDGKRCSGLEWKHCSEWWFCWVGESWLNANNLYLLRPWNMQ